MTVTNKIQNIKKKIKSKDGAVQSSEYVIYFFLTIILILMILQILLAVFSIYNYNVVASNIARSVSINGGFDASESSAIYDMAAKELDNKAKDGSLSVKFINPEDGTTLATLSKANKIDDCVVDLGEQVEVIVSGKAPFLIYKDKGMYIDISATASGIGEIYHKTGGGLS